MSARLMLMLCFLYAGAVYAAADDNAAANKIFVETVQLLNQAATAQPLEAVGLYEKALRNLDRIVTDYPSSTLAVQLVSGQSIGHISRPGIEKTLTEARKVACAKNLRALCVLTEALEVTRGIKDAEPRVRALAAIAAVQAKAGNVRQAGQTFDETLKIAQSAPYYALLLPVLARAQGEAGNVHEALQLINHPNSDLRLDVFIPLPTIHPIALDSNDAMRALTTIAAAQARDGNTKEALATARRAGQAHRLAIPLAAIAAVQAKAGNMRMANQTIAEAIRAARSTDQNELWWRAEALFDIAIAHATAGNVIEASQTLAEAIEAYERNKQEGPFRIFGAVSIPTQAVVVQARTGNVHAALEAARGITVEHRRAVALSTIARIQAETGDMQGARQTTAEAFAIARGIKDPEVLSVVADSLVAIERENQNNKPFLTKIRAVVADTLKPVHRARESVESFFAKKVSEEEQLGGSWQVTYVLINGKFDSQLLSAKIIFYGDTMSLVLPDEKEKREFHFKLDPSKRPKEFNMTALTGDYKGSTNPGIYQLEGDILRLCMSDDHENKERPKEFASKEGSELVLLTLIRAKP